MYSNRRKINNNNGFTLVELIVVLALMAILLSITIFSGLAWQDYARFNHEEAVAEDIFFAAQNQLTEFDASGAMEGRVQSPLWKSGTKDYVSGDNGYVLATANNTDLLHSIIYKNGNSDSDVVKYNWDNIWKEYLKGSNNDASNQKATIVRLVAEKGDYDKYLIERAGKTHEGTALSAGTTLLFDIVSPYLADTSVLNGCIALEFSPEAGQVFSVCYSDVASKFEYTNSTSGGTVGIIDRRIQTRKEHMVGYYSADQLYEKLKGKEKNQDKLRLEIRSEEVLEMIVHDGTGKIFNNDNVDRTLVFSLFNGDPGSGDASILDFSLTYNYANYKATSVEEGINNAVANPQVAKTNAGNDNYIIFNSGKYSSDSNAYQCRFPVWIDSNSGDMHIILDAADVQAESYAYYKAMMDENGTTAEKQAYNPDGYAYHKDLATKEDDPIGECIAFNSYAKDTVDINKRLIDIKNGRHLFNMRYETDYKSKSEIKNEFKLTENIDWAEFVGKAGDSNTNFFLNSFDEFVDSGIDLEIGDTKNIPYPGYRCLSKGDSFIQENAFDPDDATKNNYKISNLTISITDNIRYGVYDSVFYDPSYSAEDKQKYTDIKKHCMSDDFTEILGADGLSRRGMLPLGLFAENLGTIQNITLDKHVVRGMEVLRNDSDKNIIYTNMVGGFAGNNIGDVSGLTLLATDNKTHINGRTDVGGIVGRQSFSASPDKDVELSNLKNNAEVTGYENVGGIVGRVYVHYINDVNNTSQGDPGRWASDTRKNLYHDGYDITDTYKSMSRAYIFRAKTVSVKDCENTGHVTGDPMIYNESYRFEGKTIAGDSFRHCAFIGGIAGITQDGLIIDDSSMNNAVAAIQDYVSKRYYDNGSIQYVKVENCKSETLYVKKDELSESKMALFANGDSGCRDCYVGGLIGYARLTNIIECNNDNTTDADFSGDEIPFVIGQNYVGGLIGCSDESRIVLAEGSSSSYSAINKNLVIGERYVGGIAGAFGIGDITHYSLNFKEPALNEASQPSCVISNDVEGDLQKLTPHGDKKYRNRFIIKLCNKGIVLGVKNDKNLNYVLEKSSDTDRYSGIRNPNVGSGMIGGIAGACLNPIEVCDNIQSEDTKDYLLTLVGITEDDLDNTETVINKIEGSSFGGTCVGGLVGTVRRYGFLNRESIHGNRNELSNSNIDAIVFGQDYVGGAFGTVDDRYTNPYNFYPSIKNSTGRGIDGMVVIGRDVVGGFGGYVSKKFDNHVKSNGGTDTNFDNTQAITTPYKVYGRYAVGGYIGVAKHTDKDGSNNYVTAKIKMSSDNRISVNGIAYTGGFIGVCESSYPGYYAEISGVDVNGKYFTGGCFGALDTIKTDKDNYFTAQPNPHILSTVMNRTQSGKNNYVYVYDSSVNTTVFGGSVVGLYSIASSGYHFSSKDINNVPNGNLYNVAESLKSEGYYMDAASAFNTIVNSDIESGIFSQEIANSYTVDMATNANGKFFESAVSVNSELFAGGFFGYVPDGTKLTFKNFINKANLNATGSIGAESVNEMKSADGTNTDKFAYLGGVIGRIPRGMTVETCTNEVAVPENNYKAENATYLGGLTEVNAGKILYCENATEFSYGSGGVGAFAGVNGTNVTSILYNNNNATKEAVITLDKQGDTPRYLNSNGIIAGCKNTGKITSTDGFAGGIAAADGTSINTNVNRNSAITKCVNLGDISGKDAAGIVSKAGGKDIITYCRNYGNLTGTASTYGIAGAGVGDINKNLEAGNRSVTNIGDPVAPMASNNLTKNFYISGYTSDSQSGGSSTPVDINNKGKAYFNIDCSLAGMADKMYNKEEVDGSRQTTWSMGVNNNEDVSIVYSVLNEAGEPRSLKMKNFTLVFGNDGYAPGYTYVFDVEFLTKDANGKTVPAGPAVTSSVIMNEYTKMAEIEAPSNVDIYGINVEFHYSVLKDYNPWGANILYCCAYYMDGSGKHYINDISKIIDYDATSSELKLSGHFTDGQGNNNGIMSQAAPSQTSMPTDNNSYFKEIWLDNYTNKTYHISYDISSPSNGLDAQKIRLYWSQPFDSGNNQEYTVILSYLDSNGDEQKVYRYRKFNLASCPSDPYLFYDDINCVDCNGASIKPTKIDILLDYTDANGNPKTDICQANHYGAITWFDNTEQHNEKYLADKNNVYTYDMATEGNVSSTSIFENGSMYLVNSTEDWQTAVSSDHWSKQLLVNDRGMSSFNLAYSRSGVVKENLTTGTYANFTYDPNDVNVNAETRFNQFDKWFIEAFIDNPDYFGTGKEGMFVDPN